MVNSEIKPIELLKNKEYLGNGTSYERHLLHQQELVAINNNTITEDLHLDITENNMTVSDEYIKENFDYKKYQAELNKVLASAEGTRNKAAAAAKYLATQFPKLPYFWGGGHELSPSELVGINENWGKIEKIIYGESEFYQVGEELPYSLDCSGFLSWCLVNAGYEIDKCLGSGDCRKIGESINIKDNDAINRVQVGDFGWLPGHVGIVIDVNKDTNEVSFAHLSNSGCGMNITTISTETGKVTHDDLGVTINKYGERVEGRTTGEEVGTDYFTEIILVPYDS